MDPFTEVPTLTMVCDVLDPITRERYSRDPRYIAQKAEAFLIQTALADTAYFGPELEFFVFDDIRYDFRENCGYYFIDSIEGRWNSGREEQPNLGYKPRYKEGYFPVPPSDTLQDLRTEMVLTLERVGITVEAQHHEVATAGQCEIDMRFSPLTQMADKVMWYKYIIKNVARRHHKTATFMPKPIFNDNGTGMHVHQSLWKSGQPLFPGNDYAGLSKTALYYIGGILHHAPALCALVAPTTNSYKRLVPGFEAPVNLAYSSRNRSAGVRIPMYFTNPKAKRIEVRFPDGSSNPYLAFAAMLMAGLDGVINEMEPPDPIDENLYDLPPEEAAKVKQVPGSLEAVLNALEQDYEFLLRGGVFTEDLIETWLDLKRSHEMDPLRLRPHPYEFFMYFDA
jgi:glutamine synthetase